MPKHIYKKTEKELEKVGVLPSLTEWNGKVNKSGDTITGKLSVQSGDASGCLQIGADVASNTLTAGTRKLARMTFPTREYGTTKTCSIMSCDNMNNYNYVEFGGHIGDATNTAPDYMCFNVDKTHNSLSPATKECVMAISPTSLRLFNGAVDAGQITSFDSISGKWVFNNANTFKNGNFTYTLPAKEGTIALKEDFPKALKNPNALTFGTKTYDGSSAQTITLADLGGQAAGNYAILDSNGKLADSVIPAVAITDTYVVANESAMLALNAQKGDIAIRSDLNKSFVLQVTPASTLANWKELLTPTDAVLSVNSKKGAVTLNLDDIKDGSTRKLADYLPLSGGNITGALSAAQLSANIIGTNIIGTGTEDNNFFQSRKFRGEGDAATYYHAVDFGFAGHNQVDFYEYGGIWNFWKNTEAAATTDSNNLCLQIGDTYVKNKGNKFTWPTTGGTLALTSNIPTAATAADNILHGSNNGMQITYAPYTAQQSKLSFDTSTTAPTRTDRLNLNGSLYATKFNVAGKAAVQYNSTEDCIEFIFA